MLEKVKKHILTSVIAGAILYLLLSIYADYTSVFTAFKQFGIFLIPLLLTLSFLNYFSRFLKWHYYLSILKIKISYSTSLLIFMSGLIMSVTPGKFGELLKSFMLKQIVQTPISKTAPIMLVERITDFISLLFIAILGSYVFGIGELIIAGTSCFFILLIIVLSNKSLAKPFFGLIHKIKFLVKYIDEFEEAYESAYILLKPKPLVLMSLFSIVAWFFECYGFYLILVKFNIEITMLWSSFTYAFATILGSITMLPGGLGITDGSLTFMIMNHGIESDVAVASTFIIRVVTLWFAVLVGIISVSIYQRRFGEVIFEKN